jgi:hypothetical protein
MASLTMKSCRSALIFSPFFSILVTLTLRFAGAAHCALVLGETDGQRIACQFI